MKNIILLYLSVLAFKLFSAERYSIYDRATDEIEIGKFSEKISKLYKKIKIYAMIRVPVFSEGILGLSALSLRIDRFSLEALKKCKFHIGLSVGLIGLSIFFYINTNRLERKRVNTDKELSILFQIVNKKIELDKQAVRQIKEEERESEESKVNARIATIRSLDNRANEQQLVEERRIADQRLRRLELENARALAEREQIRVREVQRERERAEEAMIRQLREQNEKIAALPGLPDHVKEAMGIK